jgi:Family of unknown function (DUF6188)
LKLSDQRAEDFISAIVGRKLSALDKLEFSWSFQFEDVATLMVGCSWRILSERRVALTSLDDGQQFGLPNPIDAHVQSKQLLLDRVVRKATARGDTGDLAIDFGDSFVLEVLIDSSGYEAWQLSTPRGATLVATGGGKLVFA